ncbi:MAG: UDP-3-O-acyl-N-acetylglucosamine deacetylase, partial [Pseudomonadota bacterium]
MGLQTTLRNRIQCAGVGLHTGEDVRMVLRPAGPNTGIVFRRTDVDPETGVVPAKYDLVSHTTLGTTITNAHGVGVATVEHLMAALAGLEVDNAIVELNGPEV